MSEQRARYKVTNWGSYNKSLVARGSVTLWWEEGVEESWYAEEAMHRRGRPCTYSDRTMELCMTLKALFHLPYRATEGFVQSLLALMHLTLRVPCYTQIHRRAKTLTGVLKRYAKHQGSVDMVVDSTGLKIYGEGEWKVRTHGASKRRTWRKLHIGIDPLNHEVLCMVLTGAELSDDHALPQLLAQVPDPIERCIGDGAFDTSACYEACHARGIRLLTPPCRNAVAEPPGQERDAMAPRNRAIETYPKHLCSKERHWMKPARNGRTKPTTTNVPLWKPRCFDSKPSTAIDSFPACSQPNNGKRPSKSIS